MWRERLARGVVRLLLHDYETHPPSSSPARSGLSQQFREGQDSGRRIYRDFLHKLASRLTSPNAGDSDFLAGSVYDEPPHADSPSPDNPDTDIADKELILWRFYVGPSLTDAEVPPLEVWLEEPVTDALHDQHEIAWSAVIEFLEAHLSEAS
jgi:hypothetical protein